MKENTKYSRYRFAGDIFVDEVQPWYDFGTAKPWDDPEIPWLWDNKVNREILTILSDGPKSLDEIKSRMSFSPKALLINAEEYNPKIHYQWEKESIMNHLSSLEWYHLVSFKDEKYEINFPFFNLKELEGMDDLAKKLADDFIKPIIKSIGNVDTSSNSSKYKTTLLNLLLEKLVNEMYSSLKQQGIIPDEPNIKVLWAEQLRKENFEDWLNQQF